MEYHFEHHLFPNLPHYQLKRFHNKLLEKGFFKDNNEDVLSGGYLHFWNILFGEKKIADAN